MSVTRLPVPAPRNTGGILRNALGASTDLNALMQAHRHAAAFHEAMAGAIEAERELQDKDLLPSERKFWQDSYTRALGQAVIAQQKMPVIWAAVLNVKVPSETSAEIQAAD